MFKPYEGNEKYIFVSYNHDDSEKVYDIITEFHHRGYRIWHDKGIPLGDSFLEHLAMREKECSVVFSFLSPAYFESQYCMQELKFAVTNGKPIIPIMLEVFELPTSGDFMMGVINRIYLSWFDSIEEFADQLAEAGAKYLDPCKAKPDGTPPVQPTPPAARTDNKAGRRSKEQNMDYCGGSGRRAGNPGGRFAAQTVETRGKAGGCVRSDHGNRC